MPIIIIRAVIGTRRECKSRFFFFYVPEKCNNNISVETNILICLFISMKKSYATAVLGGSAYSAAGIKSPYEQIVRIDGMRKIDDTDLDLYHLASPAAFSWGVAPLTIPLFQPSPGADDTCYAVGYGPDRGRGGNHTEIVVLRPSADTTTSDDSQCKDDEICLTVTQKPQSCSVRRTIVNITV